MTRTKQEHHIPQKSYLDYFVDTENNNLLWVYQDKNGIFEDIEKVAAKNISSINFCKEAYFYEAPQYRLNTIEKALSDIEGKYKSILENKILKKEKLTEEEKEVISYFISTLEMRTTASKQNINNFIDRVSKHFTALEEQFKGGEMTENHKELLKLKEENTAFAQTVAISMEVNRWRISDFVFMFVRYEEGEDQFFITSDHPVTLCDFTMMNGFYGIPPLSSTAEVVIPLTPKVALFVNNIGVNGYIDIDPNFVSEVNNRVLISSNKYVISPKKLTKKFIYKCTTRFRQSLILLSLQDCLDEEWRNRHRKKD